MLSVLTADVTLYAFTVMNNVLGYLLIGWVLAKEVTSLDQLKGVFRTLTLVHIAVAALTPQMFSTLTFGTMWHPVRSSATAMTLRCRSI